MLGAVVNFLAILGGGLIGMLLNRGISDRVGDSIMKGLALCVLYIGFRGALSGENVLIAILSMVIGGILGEWLDLDGKIQGLGNWAEKRFSRGKESLISEGFVTGSLLYCVGAMAIVGSLQSGLSGIHETLFAKSLIDGIAAVVLASSLGVGVLISAGTVLIYEGSLTMLAQGIAPYLTTTVINEMTCVGSLLMIGLSLNMLHLTDLKVMNLVPAIFLPIILCIFL